MHGECDICGSCEHVRHINLYVSGSEGLTVCTECEMHIVTYVRSLRQIAAKAKLRMVKFYKDQQERLKKVELERVKEERDAAKKLGVHLSHCNFGENVNACKYGQDNCPALSEEWSWLGKALEQRANLQAELERVRGELAETKEVEVALSSKVAEYEIELNGDPQNFYGRGRTVGLRTLIAALPKVEGEILEQSDFAFVRYEHADGPLPEIPRCNQIALLQYRKKMKEY